MPETVRNRYTSGAAFPHDPASLTSGRHHMKSTILLITAVVAIQLSGALQQPSDAEPQLEAAIHKETVQGDLKAAIALYNRVIERYGKVRPIAAKALFHKGECQEKLGQ